MSRDRQPAVRRARLSFHRAAGHRPRRALHVHSISDAVPFYRDVLGFRLSDYMTRPFNAFLPRQSAPPLDHPSRPGAVRASSDGRAHSLGDIEQCRPGAGRGRPHVTLSLHPARSPRSTRELAVEVHGGVRLGRAGDRHRQQSRQIRVGPSMWGHDRLDDAGEAVEAREVRIAAADAGPASR